MRLDVLREQSRDPAVAIEDQRRESGEVGSDATKPEDWRPRCQKRTRVQSLFLAR
jgi:hypothetical protein